MRKVAWPLPAGLGAALVTRGSGDERGKEV